MAGKWEVKSHLISILICTASIVNVYSRFPFRKIMIYAVIASTKSSDGLPIQPLVIRFEWLMLFAAVIFLIAFVQSTKMDSLLKMDFYYVLYTRCDRYTAIYLFQSTEFFLRFSGKFDRRLLLAAIFSHYRRHWNRTLSDDKLFFLIFPSIFFRHILNILIAKCRKVFVNVAI